MYHDSSRNDCPKDGFIMSPSRGVYGETIWSECSRKVAHSLFSEKPCLLDAPEEAPESALDHQIFGELPGRKVTAKKQCELFLRDEDAIATDPAESCESLQCKTPHRIGFYYAGPALEGTLCGAGKECHGGECVFSTPEYSDYPEFSNHKQPVWSDWKYGSCKSGCIRNSRGAYEKRRSCLEPSSNSVNCPGLLYKVNLCRDDAICNNERRSATDFANLKCDIFSEKLTHLDGRGLQAPHEYARPWMACAIFCRRKDIASYYTPRIELNDLGIDPYFPDGTWCHRKNGEDFFCRQHHCLPENFEFPDDLALESEEEEVFGLQNARPKELRLSQQMVSYLSLDNDGRPLLTTLIPDIGTRSREDDWSDRDYNELPETFTRPPKESTSASHLNFM